MTTTVTPGRTKIRKKTAAGCIAGPAEEKYRITNKVNRLGRNHLPEAPYLSPKEQNYKKKPHAKGWLRVIRRMSAGGASGS